jgi:hypothetical protein
LVSPFSLLLVSELILYFDLALYLWTWSIHNGFYTQINYLE